MADFGGLSITNVSTVYNTATIKIYNQTTETTGNYNINITYGSLEVTPLEIEITSKGLSEIYDGQEHKIEELELSLNSDI